MTSKPLSRSTGAPIPQKYPDEIRDVVFEMHYVQDKKYREIAEALQMPITSVSSILKYDISRLRAYSKALIKHKRRYKLNLASDKTLSLLLAALDHIETKLEKATDGSRPLDDWELNSYTKTLMGTYRVIEEARRAGKLDTKPVESAYNTMRNAQVIDVNDIANLPDNSPTSTLDINADIEARLFEEPIDKIMVNEDDKPQSYNPSSFFDSLVNG